MPNGAHWPSFSPFPLVRRTFHFVDGWWCPLQCTTCCFARADIGGIGGHNHPPAYTGLPAKRWWTSAISVFRKAQPSNGPSEAPTPFPADCAPGRLHRYCRCCGVFTVRCALRRVVLAVPTNQAVGALDSLRYYLQVLANPHASARQANRFTAQSIRYFNGGVRRLRIQPAHVCYQWLEEVTSGTIVAGPDLNTTQFQWMRQWSTGFSLSGPAGGHCTVCSNTGLRCGTTTAFTDLRWRDLPHTFAPPELDIREERDQASADIEEQMRQARGAAEL